MLMWILFILLSLISTYEWYSNREWHKSHNKKLDNILAFPAGKTNKQIVYIEHHESDGQSVEKKYYVNHVSELLDLVEENKPTTSLKSWRVTNEDNFNDWGELQSDK